MVYDNDIIILSHGSVKSLALGIEEQFNKLNSPRKTQYRDCIKWNSFNDGWPNLFISNVEDLVHKDVVLVTSLEEPSVVFEQLSVTFSLPRYRVKSLLLVSPYFATGTMERVDNEGQIATANTLARLISAAPLTYSGPIEMIVMDIHALQERFYFGDHIIPRLLSAIPLLIERLDVLRSKPSIAFPDEGAYKRFSSFFTGYHVITCNKERRGDERIISIREGDAHDRHIVIVDDLVQSGGTLLETIKVLKAGGAASISAYVTHAIFPNKSWQKFTQDGLLDAFWITDSLSYAPEIARNKPFKLLSLASVIANAIRS